MRTAGSVRRHDTAWWALLTVLPAALIAQDVPVCAQPAIHSREELVVALRRLPGEPGRGLNPEVESAFVA